MSQPTETIEQLEARYFDAQKNERHRNNQETQYWLNQWKLLARDAIAAARSEASAPETEMGDLFYVWVDRPLEPAKRTTTKPRHRHHTLEHATAEANRLSSKLGQKVIVMQVVYEAAPPAAEVPHE